MSGRDDSDTPDEEGTASLLDTVSAAFDAAEGGEEAPAPSAAPAPAQDAEEAPAEETAAEARARDEAGRFAKAEKAAEKAEKAATKQAEAKPPEVRTKGTPPKAPPGAVSAPVAPQGPSLRVPAYLKSPEAKAAWGTVPEPVRVEVLRRERELETALSTTAQDRKFASEIREKMAPYEGLLRAQGTQPVAVVESLLQAGAVLYQGAPHAKAQLMAKLCLDHQVDIPSFVAAMEAGMQGRPPQVQAQQQAQAVNPQAIIEQVYQGLMQRQEATLVQQAQGDVEGFLASQPMHGLDGTDYSDEVRQDMADILERAANRGRPISLEDAYRRAAMEHPEVSRVLAQREAAAKAQEANQQGLARRRAASSIRSNPAVPPPNGKRKGGSILDSVTDAFAQFEGDR